MKYYLLIPQTVKDNWDGIEEFVRNKNIKAYNEDYLKEIISLIALHTRKDNNSAKLNNTYLRKFVPSAEQYLKALIEIGVIYRSDYYTVGSDSYSYSFTDTFKSKYVKEGLHNDKLEYRIRKVHNEFTSNYTVSSSNRVDTVKYLYQLTVDSSYINYIETNYSEDVDRYNSFISSATRIENKDWTVKVDDTSYRLHTNVTNMKSDLRQFLRINDTPLVNIDIKNSQPFCSILLLTDPSKAIEFATDTELKDILQTERIGRNADVSKYIDLVVSGGFYEHIMCELNKEGINLTRDEAKKETLRWLFRPNTEPICNLSRQIRNKFISEFPTVHRYFSLLRGNNAISDKFKNYCRFAILLQRIESYMVLELIVKRILKEYPKTALLTIHDSIMTLYTTSLPPILSIINDTVQSYIGYRPTLKIE